LTIIKNGISSKVVANATKGEAMDVNLQPDEFRKRREDLGLTQTELGNLLDMNPMTISRYERSAGKGDNQTRDWLFSTALSFTNLIKLINSKPEAIPNPNRREELLENVRKRLCSEDIAESQLREIFYSNNGSEFTGGVEHNFKKFIELVVFFAKNGTYRTKLNKLLFYSDFLHFREFRSSITGSSYAKIPFGPVPDKYAMCYAILEDTHLLNVSPEILEQTDIVVERMTSTRPPNLNYFSTSELLAVTYINLHFGNRTSKELSELSHEEEGYKNTEQGKLIPYSYADQLSVSLQFENIIERR